MRQKIKKYFLFLIVIVFTHLNLNAQHFISRSVIGNGGALLVGTNNSLNNTFGQTIIENAEGDNFRVLFGFWNTNQFVVGVAVNDNLPHKFDLFQNYPNPFNPTTKIKYSIPKTSNVLLEVYNILGERVALLVNAEQMPGFYTLDFNAINFASGFYIYRLVAKDFVEVKKMVLLK